MGIRKGDMVQVIRGADARPVSKPTPRKVLQVLIDEGKIVVEGVNRVYKHVRRGHPKSPQGGRLSREMPIAISNVQFFCTKCNRGVRLGMRYTADGAKVRFCRKCQSEISTISPPNPKYAKQA